MTDILFVTSNPNKVREASEILGRPIASVNRELTEIQSMDLDAIITHKLNQAWSMFGQPVMVEDSGIYFDDWGGFPGPFVKHMKDTMGYDTVADILGPTRRVQWRVKAGYRDERQTMIGSGEIIGTVCERREGEGVNWGFDPYFIPDGHTLTYAQMSAEEKHALSARSQALRSLMHNLKM